VLGTLSVVAVWQQKYKSLLNIPFCLASSYHCVNNNLRSICEVAELCLPNCQGVRMSLSVSVLITKNGILGEVGVANLESLNLRVRDDRVHRNVRLVFLLIENDCMSV